QCLSMSASSSITSHGFVRVAAVTPALRLGDIPANVIETASLARGLAAKGCQIIVFPELSLTGYSCADVFMNAGFRAQALQGLENLAAELADVAALVLVGLPLEIDDRLYNTAAVLFKGAILGIIPKTFLPNSREFYERRWFSPSTTLLRDSIVIAGKEVQVGCDLLFTATDLPACRLGVEICEDLWAVIPPSSQAALQGATVLANLSAGNELLGKAEYRRQLVVQQSGRCLAAYVYSAAGPGESSTDLVFSGHSMIAENSALLAESDRFDFDSSSVIADVDVERLQHDRLHSASFRDAVPAKPWRRIEFTLGNAATAPLWRKTAAHPFVPTSAVDQDAVCREIFAIQATGLARRLRQVQAKTVMLGLSGGLDSTLALLVAIDALRRANLPDTRIMCITMPGLGTTARTKDNAVELAGALAIELRTLSISASVTQHLRDIGHPEGTHDITFENAQARERTQVLMDVANHTGGIVVGTGDLSEAALGWCTFNGDHMSMYHVNAGVPKTLVSHLIAWCAGQEEFAAAQRALTDIIATPISPELLPASAKGDISQRTEDHVGPYELVDFFLFHFVRHGCSPAKIAFLAGLAFEGVHTQATIDRWLKHFLQRFKTQQFKRSSMPDGPKVGSVALSPRGDWRMPSDLA
ncbi:MAG: nitrilase/amidohydrolase superfamily protein class 8, partial [Verrucomicrobiaceae bacterium]|nr:nitrilase/amidohydrolase superfamily protein class 8 [Verrucomicrobiaceae bacterium]